LIESNIYIYAGSNIYLLLAISSKHFMSSKHLISTYHFINRKHLSLVISIDL
jgi:hypothetical protein